MQLKIENLRKVYGEKVALDNYSITLNEGIYGVLGTNGAGKSTLMNLITDNINRTSGRILYDGTDILRLGKKFRSILGYMPQQQGIYENMTAQTYLYYMAEVKGVAKKEAKLQIERLLQATNLYDVRHKKLGGFSGGMRQRAFLAQALLGNPKVLILDEPTAGLDPEERIRIRNFISSLSRDRIILLATHIVSDIESISDKIIMMKGGRLIGFNTPVSLTESLKGKIKELPCDDGELEAMQKNSNKGLAPFSTWQRCSTAAPCSVGDCIPLLNRDGSRRLKRRGTSCLSYKVGNIFKKNGVPYVRVVGDKLPEGGEFLNDRITLEDVYLYYLSE